MINSSQQLREIKKKVDEIQLCFTRLAIIRSYLISRVLSLYDFMLLDSAPRPTVLASILTVVSLFLFIVFTVDFCEDCNATFDPSVPYFR